MGVGLRGTFWRRFATGVDMFDCVLPTRNARNGMLFTRSGKMVIKNARYAEETFAHRTRLRLLYLPALQPGLPPPPLPG